MLQWVIALLLEVSDKKSTPRVECLDALNSRETKSLIHSGRLKEFTDILQSAVMGWSSAMNIVILYCSQYEF